MSEPVKHTLAHTGERWSAKRYGYEKYAILDGRGTEIGFVHRSRDAHVIAAAPDLLHALRQTSSLVVNRVLEPGIDQSVKDIILTAYDAVAKAEGRS
jgi:hypothetical protein